MEIRRADIRDIADIVRLENECFDHPWSERLIREHLENENSVTFVCICDGVCAGYGGAVKVIDEGQITNIAVLPAFRKRGFGDALVNALVSCDFEFLTLEVRASNSPAIRLYEKHGFKKVGLRKRYYDGREDAVLMTLERGDGIGCGQE